MSREIKFRVWHRDQRLMAFISLRDFDNGGGRKLAREVSEDLGTVNLMQLTGIKDATGKEIYEGDLMEARDYWGEGDYAEVAWHEEQLQWYLKRNGHLYEPLRTPFADGHFTFTVIGNIYENKELMEREQ